LLHRPRKLKEVLRVMRCPFYWGKSMCGAKSSGLYVPPKEIEFKYCTGEFSECRRYREAEKNPTAGKANEKQQGAGGRGARESRG